MSPATNFTGECTARPYFYLHSRRMNTHSRHRAQRIQMVAMNLRSSPHTKLNSQSVDGADPNEIAVRVGNDEGTTKHLVMWLLDHVHALCDPLFIDVVDCH